MENNKKRTLDISQIPAYELVSTDDIKALNSTGYLLRHKKTKARVTVILNDDNNKVFNIGFRTPVENDTGVAHIVEHTVLCGSKKYPLKDPFVELVKGSLNTFLNAMTFPDKTIYPVASCNDKDFSNLIDVYLDAVFNPKIYEHKEIFMQEGWSYSLVDENAPLEISGVVYNEMKGAFSDPDTVVMSKAMANLFPDSSYGYESGGEPTHIPELSYEEYLDFHRRYYHPSNSFIYLYGDVDAVEKLNYMDSEYLSKYSYLEIDSRLKEQAAFEETKEATEYYSIGQNESAEDKAYFAYMSTAGEGVDKYLYYAFKILDYALISMPGAPIKKALIDAGIGTDIEGGEQNLKQRFFMIVAKCAKESQRSAFVQVVEKTLKDIVTNGINKDSLKAAINLLEFNYREADFGSYPKGLFYMLDSFESWLYDDNAPFTHIDAADTFKYLKEMSETDYFEQLIEKYLINNTHKCIMEVLPKKGLADEEDAGLAEKLKEYKSSLSNEEIKQIIKDTKSLKEYQQKPETEENLKKIPLLKIEDMDKKSILPIIEEKPFENIKMLHSNIFTNGIAYMSVYFNCENVDEKYIPYIGLFKYIFGNMDTKSHTYEELSNLINLNSGGAGNDISAAAKLDNQSDYSILFETKIKIMYDKFQFAFDVISEMLTETNIDNKKRLKEIVLKAKATVESAINSSGHSKAMLRAMSFFNEVSYYSEMLSGIGFYMFLKKLVTDFDDHYDTILEELKLTMEQVMVRGNMTIHITSDDEGYSKMLPYVDDFTQHFSNTQSVKKARDFKPALKSEAIKIPSTVQYVARCGSVNQEEGYQTDGHYQVLKNIMDYEYLWSKIRVENGAYGCGLRITRSGKIALSSYRDPQLAKTNEVYDGIPEYLRHFDADDREMTKYIIGAISMMDTPKTPRGRGMESFNAYLVGLTDEDIIKTREEVLSTTAQDIRKLAEPFEAALSSSSICVIGNGAKIDENADMFNEIIDLYA